MRDIQNGMQNNEPSVYCLAIDLAGRCVDHLPTKYPILCPCKTGRQLIYDKRKFINHITHTTHILWVMVSNKKPLPPPPPPAQVENTGCAPPAERSVNKGTGAGGSNTNYYGKLFEEKTINPDLQEGYRCANNYYLLKRDTEKTIVFVLQYGFKTYMKNKYNITMFRCPDEAYIIEYNTGKKVIKIIEKKEQKVEGSVETKLWSGPSLKREYEIVLGEAFEVHYAFCVNAFLKHKLLSNNNKYIILNRILNENNIVVMFGDDDDYFEKANQWLNNSL